MADELDIDALKEWAKDQRRFLNAVIEHDKLDKLIAAYREREGLKLARDEMQRQRAELYDKLNGTPCAEIRWQQERDALIAKLQEAERERDEFAGMAVRLRTERDLLRQEASDARRLADGYKAEFAQLKRDLEAAKRSREGQLQNTIASTKERDEARAESASLRSRIDVLASALRPFARMGELIEGYANTKASPVNLTEYGEHFRRARAALSEDKP